MRKIWLKIYAYFFGKCAAYGHTFETRMYDHYGMSMHPYQQCTQCPERTRPEGIFTYEEVYESMLKAAGLRREYPD